MLAPFDELNTPVFVPYVDLFITFCSCTLLVDLMFCVILILCDLLLHLHRPLAVFLEAVGDDFFYAYCVCFCGRLLRVFTAL